MDQPSHFKLKNNYPAGGVREIPISGYDDFYSFVTDGLKDEARHCLAYYGIKTQDSLKLYCFLADDPSGNIEVAAYETGTLNPVLRSAADLFPQLSVFEREINENFGVVFEGHPWMKGVRFPHNRRDKSKTMENYPFYGIESEELHEVGVGPVHAGVIEPGHFRFICNGEKVLHLEIQLGYQHRGTEDLFLSKNTPLQRCILAESIAGDTAVGHSLAHTQLIESLTGLEPGEALQIERCVALEMERIAVHIGDTAALCGDVAYQLGQVVCEAIRTRVINTTQLWCGNRFGKGLIRSGGSNFPLSEETAAEIIKMTDFVDRQFSGITECIYSSPSVLARFEDIGTVTGTQARQIGAVGIAARTCGMARDVRKTHPFQYFRNFAVNPAILETGDVLARGMIRKLEVRESLRIIRELLEVWAGKDKDTGKPDYSYKLKPGAFSVSVVEGWRGEIVHSCETDAKGNLVHYKVKDPSVHNWMALALAVRSQEISDFPVCNKSFNLSYCGHDL